MAAERDRGITIYDGVAYLRDAYIRRLEAAYLQAVCLHDDILATNLAFRIDDVRQYPLTTRIIQYYDPQTKSSDYDIKAPALSGKLQ